MGDSRKRACFLLWRDQELKIERLSRERSTEPPRVENRTIFDISFKREVRDEFQPVFQDLIATEHIREPLLPSRLWFDDSYPKDLLQRDLTVHNRGEWKPDPDEGYERKRIRTWVHADRSPTPA